MGDAAVSGDAHTGGLMAERKLSHGDDVWVAEQIGAIREAVKGLAEKVAERYSEARAAESDTADTLGKIATDLGGLVRRVDVIEADLKRANVNIDAMQIPINQFVSLRQRVLSLAAVAAMAGSVFWYFWKPISERFLSAWGKM